MTQQYLRNISLKLRNGERELDLSEMHVRFDIQQAMASTPNAATIRVYNLSRETQRIAYEEFTHLDLMVGYSGELSRLFYGQIRQFNGGRRASSIDTFIDFICQSGDFALNYTPVASTLAAGWSYKDLLGISVNALVNNGLLKGYVADVDEAPFPRGKVVYGSAKDFMTHVANNVSADWSVENGEIVFIPFQGTRPDEAVVLTSDTGLLGLPQQTINGVEIECLINPKIQDGSLIQLDNAAIQAADIDVGYQADLAIPSLSQDGLYKVYLIDHTGDTRGNEWYSRITCIAADHLPENIGQAYANRGINRDNPLPGATYK